MAKANRNIVIPSEITDKVKSGNGHATAKKTQGFISLFPGELKPLDDNITEILTEIQQEINTPLWFIVHDGNPDHEVGSISGELWDFFYNSSNDLEAGKPISIVIFSPGGDAEASYRIAKFIRNKCGAYNVIIPNYAKSAATLLSLGANEIMIGVEADLGPLDVQITDHNEEKTYSALDEVQAIDGLFEFANAQIIQTTTLWSRTMKKRKQTIFPSVVEYVTGMMKPLMEKIDTVHYMSLQRTLRIAEEYAYRLLLDNNGHLKAKLISKHFVEKYPYHGFIIDFKECRKIGLTNTKEIPSALQHKFDKIFEYIKESDSYFIGKFYTKKEL